MNLRRTKQSVPVLLANLYVQPTATRLFRWGTLCCQMSLWSCHWQFLGNPSRLISSTVPSHVCSARVVNFGHYSQALYFYLLTFYTMKQNTEKLPLCCIASHWNKTIGRQMWI